MNTRLAELAGKRAQLVARAASQREQISGLVRQCQGPLTVAEKGFAMVRFVRGHPLLFASVGVGAAFLIARRAGGLRKWGGRLATLWQTAHSARSWWSKM